jgi:glycosyltransferase involved in cell wall biosynthesis
LNLSVIIPVKNSENSIAAAIKSVLDQDFENFEILIGVDKCNDKTVDVLHGFRNFSNIKIFEFNHSMGTAQILNQLIQNSMGKYIVRMDADDLMIRNRLKHQFNFLESNLSYGVLASRSVNKENISAINQFSRQLNCDDFLNINPISHPTIVFRKSSLSNLSILYSIKYKRSQDYELWTRLVRKTRFYFLDIPAIEYNSHTTIRKVLLQFYFFSKAKYKNLFWHVFRKQCSCSSILVLKAILKIPYDFKILFTDVFKIFIR